MTEGVPPHLRIVENEPTDGRWPFEKLSAWIEQHGDGPPDDELRDWLETWRALHRSEIDMDGEVEEFMVLDGLGAVLFSYCMQAGPDGTTYRYSITRYTIGVGLAGD